MKRIELLELMALMNCFLLTFSLFKIVNWLKVSSRFGLIVSVIRHVAMQSWSFVLIFVINIIFFSSIQITLGAEVDEN